jgi:hypothetical protein
MACALGFRAHSGWAAVVVLTDEPRVLHRGRLELVEGGSTARAQIYHATAKLPLAQAEKRVAASIADSAQRARAGIAALIQEHRPMACGIVVGKVKTLPPLDAILRSHAMIHTAEGVLYRSLLVDAARELGLATLAVPAADVGKHRDRKRIDALGRGLGPPWSQDQKESALVAWMALQKR